MKSLKIRMCLIVALLFVFIAALGAFAGLTASADRNVTVSGSSAFNTAGNAQVWAHRVENKDSEGNDDPWYYTMFVFSSDDDAVNYRRNLAYKWFYNPGDVDDTLRNEPKKGDDGKWHFGSEATEIDYDASVTPEVGANGHWFVGETDTDIVAYHQVMAEKQDGYFRMEIGFEKLNFQKFTLTFETQQYNLTKDKKTTNYIIFLPVAAAEGATPQKVYALVTDDGDIAEKEAKDIDVTGLTELDADRLVITLCEEEGLQSDQFGVKIFNAANEEANAEPTVFQKGVFGNVGKMFATYSSSSTNPVIPLSFKADLPEDSEDKVCMALYSLNGQSFALNRNSKGETVSTGTTITEETASDGSTHYVGGQVNDVTPPVLCLEKGLTYIKSGSEISLSVTAVDVLVQTPTLVTGYFMLNNEQLADVNFNPDDPEAEKLFKTVTGDMDHYIYPHVNSYLPISDDYGAGSPYGEDLSPVAAVKIYLKLTDTTASNGQSTYVFMDWFVDEQYKLNIDGKNYIAVAEDNVGATFNYDGAEVPDGEGATKNMTWEELVADYQQKVDKAAFDLRAGADDFYLPSLEYLISDNATQYKDMTYSIYYITGGSWSQNTVKAYNQLSIDLDKAGEYIFTVYANDGNSNKMWYNVEKDGNTERVEFDADEIQDMFKDEDNEGLHDRLPWFTFTAGIAEISVEDPGEQDTAYVGATYTAKSFEIEGLSTTATYTLYRFEKEMYRADNGEYLTYEKFMETKEQLFEDYQYFTNIPALSSLEDGSKEYDEFGSYAWNASARSFIPQDENSFYLIRCKVTSSLSGDQSVSAYMGISASATPPAIVGEDTWLQDNMTSIILLSIAGAALIGILLLVLIKPKEKGDIDEQYAAEVAKSKKK